MIIDPQPKDIEELLGAHLLRKKSTLSEREKDTVFQVEECHINDVK